MPSAPVDYVVKIGTNTTTDSIAVTTDPPVVEKDKEQKPTFIIFNANGVPQLIIPWNNYRYAVVATAADIPTASAPAAPKE
jgi:hypothetical protein